MRLTFTSEKSSLMKKSVRRVLVALLAVLIVMQFIQPDKTNPESPAEADFLAVHNVDGEVGGLIKRACYDCHSNNTRWPWYTSVAPFSYIIADHVEEGREHLNFSEWTSYSADKADHKLEECAEEVEHGEMPLSGYVALHSEADLSNEELEMLVDYFESLRK